jgi:hypothetical protein
MSTLIRHSAPLIEKAVEPPGVASNGLAARPINERYADSIIGDRHAEYDGLEVHGVRNLGDSIPWFRNDYECPCGNHWSDEWSASCNDKCAECNKEIEPSRSEDLTSTECEVDDANPEFFSVYVHVKTGGVECVGDFATHELATQYAAELAEKYVWPIRDFAKLDSPTNS